MVQFDKRATCLSILMAAVNWDGTEKVMNTRAVTLSFYLMISYKILCRSRTASSTVKKNQNAYIFKSFNLFPKYLFKQRYLPETSYIKMIQTIHSIH